MRTYRAKFLILLLLCFAVQAAADSQSKDVAEVEALLRDYYGALNRGDALAAESRWSKTRRTSEYPRHGGLLEVFPPQSLEEAAAAMAEAIENGLKLDLEIHHLHAEVYGDAAVGTLYSSGTVTYPGGHSTGGTARVSYFLVREPGGWKIVHMHSSPVRIRD